MSPPGETYEPVVVFHDQSASYGLGVEAGIVFETLRQGEEIRNLPVHVENLPTLHQMATYRNKQFIVDPTNDPVWCLITAVPNTPPTSKPRPKLSVAGGNDA